MGACGGVECGCMSGVECGCTWELQNVGTCEKGREPGRMWGAECGACGAQSMGAQRTECGHKVGGGQS